MSREWSNSICGCLSNIPWCLVTCFCPCTTSYLVGSRLGLACMALFSVILWLLANVCYILTGYAGIKTEIDINPDKIKELKWEDFKNDTWGAIIAIADILCLFFLLLFVFVVYRMRVNMRKIYDLEGGCCSDCICGCCCWPLSLCQMKNHIDEEGITVTRA
ncbi:uncharacterized protein LOC142337430 [Convolutriloba macropyga]|uniref:uncharacterized protein LOC142337430 n=1 Tax=Convolutriloba macropyga TaxID=536237 RepID=UPI003F51C923